MPIDVHAHYVPPQLIDAIAARGKDIGVRLVRFDNAPPALHFDYGFKVRPFFPRLIEPVGERRAWLDEQGIDVQIVGTWPDIFGYGFAADACAAWHRMLNDTLAAWCADNSDRFAWIGSVPLIQADAAAQELERAGELGACGMIISSNIENTNLGELPLEAFWRKAEALGMPVLIHPGSGRTRATCGKFRPRSGCTVHLRHHARHRLGADVRCAGPLSPPQAGAVPRRRCISLSRRPFRHHASTHGPRRARRCRG
jgi:predicted TIM-barrel fold metal-dependent hydrolase